MTDRQRILLVRLSHLGDVCHALALFHGVRERYPTAELGWVVQAEFAPLVAPLPGLARTFAFDRRGGWRAWRDLRRELRAWSADWAIDAQGNFKSAAAAWFSGAPRRSGLHLDDWRERLAARSCTDRAARATAREPGAPAHAMDKMHALLAHVGGGGEPAFDPVVSAAELAAAEITWARRVGDEGAIILAPGRAGDVRSWPEAHFIELARRLAGAGRAVLVLSGPAEREVGERIAAVLRTAPAVRHWVGQSGLRELAAFFTVAARRGARLVTHDGGILHLASACGLRTVLLHGPQDPRRTGPWPTVNRDAAHHRLVAAAEPPACAPCRRRSCTHLQGPVCMSALDVRTVLEALHERAERPTAHSVPAAVGESAASSPNVAG